MAIDQSGPRSLKRQCGLQAKPKVACIQRTHVHRDSGSLAIGATSPNPKWGSSVWEMSGRGLGSVWWGSVRGLGGVWGCLERVWGVSGRGL